MKTIQAVSAPCLNQVPSQKHTPITAQEAKEKHEASQETQAAINTEVADFMTYATTKASTLGKRFDKSTRFFLDMFFQGGAHLVNHQEKVNVFNAFQSEKAAERHEEGAPGLKAQGLHDLYKAEYEVLTEEEKTALVDRFTETKDKVPKARHDTPRARIHDVSNTVRNIQMLMHGLSYCVGVEGFFCIVRNNPDFHMIPQWYFTSWSATCHLQLEAFAITGCDTMNLLRTNKQKVDFLKAEIQEGVHGGLGTHDNGQANDESIIVKYGVELIGWLLEHFINPSDLSSSLPILTQAPKAEWEADVAAGKVVERARALRCDTGKKRKAATIEDDNEGGGKEMLFGTRDDAMTRAAIEKVQMRRVKSHAIMADSDDSDENVAPTPAPAAANSRSTAEAHAITIDPTLLLAA
ncbi:hypothetical protein B0H10DRAFT_2246619 [Mycena sp. CBHHK59/15]|nr:hypothetical protein B0H10DRAFT_2246619 [Mycena sp. CBHHK59/15]